MRRLLNRPGRHPIQPRLHREQLALKKQLSKLLLALDSDNPVRVKSEMTTLEQQLPAGALVAIGVSVLGYDFRSAEPRTRQLATDNGVDLGD